MRMVLITSQLLEHMWPTLKRYERDQLKLNPFVRRSHQVPHHHHMKRTGISCGLATPPLFATHSHCVTSVLPSLSDVRSPDIIPVVAAKKTKEKRLTQHWAKTIDILYTLDSASNYSAIQKLKPWLQTPDIPMKWEDSYVFYFLNRELNIKSNTFKWWNYSNDESYCCF
jgi:hypothetical protein